MAAAAILNNRKIAISRPQFDRFRPNLARRRTATLLSRPTVKIFTFLKSNPVASLSHWVSTLLVCSTFAVIQRVARVCQWQLVLCRWCKRRFTFAICYQPSVCRLSVCRL